jgi:hypothetical protein
MSPDRCKVCGTVHRRRDPHVWSGELQDKTVDMLNEVVGNPLLLELLEREVHEVHSDVHANVNDVHADRAAYQREYMKKWRASQKAKA